MLRKIYNSSILNSWFSNIIVIVSMVIAIPFVITKLSIEAVNVWFLFATVVSLTQGVVLGFSSTFSRFISYIYAGVSLSEVSTLKDKNYLSHGEINIFELEQILNVIKPLYLILSIAFFLLLSLIGYFFLSKPISMMENSTEGWYAWFIVLFTSGTILYLNFYQVFLDGINKVALVQRVIGIVNLFGLFLILLVLIFIPSLLSITIIYQLVSVTTFTAIAYFGLKSMKDLSLNISLFSFDKNVFFLIWQTARKSLYTTILASIVKHISSLIVAQLLPPAQSASFQFVKRIFDVIERFTATTFQSKIPMLSRLRGRGDIFTFSQVLIKTQYITYAVFLIGYSIFLFFGNSIVDLIDSEVKLDNILIVAFGFSVLVTRWIGMNLAVSNQANNVVEHLAISISSIIYFILIYIFINKISFYIFPIAQILGMLFISPFVIKQVYQTFNSSFVAHEFKMLIPVFIVALVISLIGILI